MTLPIDRLHKKPRKFPVCIYLCILVSTALLLSAAVYYRFLAINLENPGTNLRKDVAVVKSDPVEVLPIKSKQRYAYVTLIHGLDSSLKYRGFLYNAIIMVTALRKAGSTADFIALVGFAANFTKDQFEDDLNLLKSSGIIIHYLPRLIEENSAVGFAEMALLKITPFSFVQYDKIQFFDGDIMPKKNMDCYFQLDRNYFCTGTASPLNSGWYLAKPNLEVFDELKEYAINRFKRSWDKQNGWGITIPDGMKFSTGKPVKQWDFNGANLDQGLFTHYFVLGKGDIGLIDNHEVRLYDAPDDITGNRPKERVVLQKDALSCCNGKSPKSVFAHFTGSSKPWLQDSTKSKNPNLKLWGAMLDELHLPYNSTNIYDQGFKPPLGYWAKN